MRFSKKQRNNVRNGQFLLNLCKLMDLFNPPFLFLMGSGYYIRELVKVTNHFDLQL